MRGLAACVGVALALACGAEGEPDPEADLRPAALVDQEGAVCGMLVRSQSAPRAQAVHRDGTTLFFCSIADLLVHLTAPSPHGRVVAVFVEGMDPAEDAGRAHLDPHPWLRAEQAVYLIGIERPGIMGEPVLSYRDTEQAAEVAARHPGSLHVDYDGLRRWWQRQVDDG